MYNEVQNPQHHEFMPLWTDLAWRHDQWHSTHDQLFSLLDHFGPGVGQDHMSLIFAESAFIMYVVSIEKFWGISEILNSIAIFVEVS